jgi:solute carrier family 25 protein 39/40
VLAPLLSGSGARVCAAFVTAPLELIRTRAHTHHKDLSALRTMMKMVEGGGVRSLWTGLGATLWRDVPFSALYWLGYERGVEALGQSEADGSLTYMAKAFTAGAGAGMGAAFVTTPFDVVKTRRQVTGGSGALASSRLPEGMSTLRALGYLARHEGPRALLHGAMPRVLRIGPACAIMISSYEGGKHLYLRQINR